MKLLKDKIVFITGASSGIGEACARQFAQCGANLILAARRTQKLETLADELQTSYEVNVLSLEMDVRNRKTVNATVENLGSKWKNIDILVNNAGLAISTDPFQNTSPDNWDTMIDTNIKGLLNVTKAILPSMLQRQAGHIINIGSTAAHEYYAGGNVYCATKHAVKALSKCFRIDLLGTNIRVSEVDPGYVHTEFSTVRWDDKKRADQFYKKFNPLHANDVAEIVCFCATRPSHVNISNVLVHPTDQASAHYLKTKD